MPTLTYPVSLIAGQRENVNDLNLILAAIQAVVNALDSANLANGAVTGDKLGTAIAQQLGVTNAANVGRGSTNIVTTESRTNAAYGTLTTADQVSNIVLPTNGWLEVGVFMTWQNSVANAGRAALFIGANQLKWSDGSAAPVVQEAAMIFATASADAVLTSMPGGLSSPNMAAAYTGDVATGQVIAQVNVSVQNGGSFKVFAAAGTYTISVQFKSASGSVTAKNRRLWVKAEGFS